jgi:hypothetical protein
MSENIVPTEIQQHHHHPSSMLMGSPSNSSSSLTTVRDCLAASSSLSTSTSASPPPSSAALNIVWNGLLSRSPLPSSHAGRQQKQQHEQQHLSWLTGTATTSSPPHQRVDWVKPFLLGVIATVVFILVITTTSIYVLCHYNNTVVASMNETTTKISHIVPVVTIPECSNVRIVNYENVPDNDDDDDIDNDNAKGSSTRNKKRSRGFLSGLFRNRRRQRDTSTILHLEVSQLLSLSSSKTDVAVYDDDDDGNVRAIKHNTNTNSDRVACACRLIWDILGYHPQRHNELDGNHEKPRTTVPSTVCTIDVEQQRNRGRTTSTEQQQPPPSIYNTTETAHVVLPFDRNLFPTAFTSGSPLLNTNELELVNRFLNEIIVNIPELGERVSRVPWGGPSSSSPSSVGGLSSDWFAFRKRQQRDKLQSTTRHDGTFTTTLQEVDGGNLLYSYLRIMKWPSNLFTTFPFKLCKKGCAANVALHHTLEFREKYKPWLVTPSVMRANKQGAVYHRGFSPDYAHGEMSGHAIVWLRMALRTVVDEGFLIRTMVQALEHAVGASMKRSDGTVGKFNIVIDGTDFSWSVAPTLPSIKALVTILQDHYVDRLGVVVLVNAGRLVEILLKIFLPLITEEVRNKIIVLSKKEQTSKLSIIVGQSNIPTWLGGTDHYEFDVDQYYYNNYYGDDDTRTGAIGTDEEAIEYRTTMPYHDWNY